VTSSGALRRALRAERADQYQRSSGAGLGWGAGAAVGIKLAAPGRPVVGVLGDGAAAYGIQALWTAAHERAGAVFVVLNNREYRAVKQGVANAGGAPELGRVGADLADPPIDWPSIAKGFGIASRRAETADEIVRTVASALATGAPCLVEIPIAGIDAAPSPSH
jgi:benzoylformate decarboxylase